MNRILRPSGYFILSTKHDSIEEEEGMAFMSFFFHFYIVFDDDEYEELKVINWT